jgi:hypothetical protein
VVARFRFTGGLDALRLRIGAVSATKGMLYWSVTSKKWQQFILDAHALSGPDGDQVRADFTLGEIAEGRTLYVQQEDNLFGKVQYKMQIRTATAGRLVLDIQNASTMRYLLIPVFEPGQVQSIHYLQQESDTVWRYYGITRTSGKTASLVADHEASAANRALAFFRYLAGIPGDLEPPAVR